MNVTAQCRRDGKFWFVTVPEVTGAMTQARALDEVPDMVRDLVRVMTGTPEHAIEVEVEADLGSYGNAALEGALALREEAEELRDRAAEAIRTLVDDLTADGYHTRDIASILGITPSRVSQLRAGRAS